MRIIPQRELRNNSGAILRSAEAGEVFAITVGGRPVATLGPYERRRWLPRKEISELLATPTDENMLDDLGAGGPEDPWDRR